MNIVNTPVTRTGGLLPSNIRNGFYFEEFQDIDAPMIMSAGACSGWVNPATGEHVIGQLLCVRDRV